MFDLILNILYALTLGFTFGSILSNSSSIKITRKQISIFIAIISIVIYCLTFWYKKNNLLVPISTIIMCMYFSIIFKNIIYSIFLSIVTQIIIALSDALTGFILAVIFKFDYCEIFQNKMIYFLGAVSILIMSFFIGKIINIFADKLNYTDFIKMNINDILIRIFSVTIVLFFMYSSLILFKNESLKSNKILFSNIFSSIMVIVLLVTIIHLHDKKIKRRLTHIHRQNEYRQLKEYINMLENNAKELRSFKHDYINILQILGSYIESENINELKDFYNNELMPESQKILANDMCFTLLQHIKINSLKGFIASKIITAQSKDIKINIQISEDIHELSIIRLIDMCRIMGVLFDNAIEAAELCHNGFIEFLIIKKDATTTFILKNSCVDSTPPVYKMYQTNFSTKGSGRGIGLKIVREMIDLKYNNVFLNTSIDNSIFKQELSIIN